jgi:uncharacterized membrane protein
MMAEVIVAVFDDLDKARLAVEALLDARFTKNDISVVVSDANRKYLEKYSELPAPLQEVTTGAAGGAFLGGLTGLLTGLLALLVPGVGPVIAVGPIAAGLIGAGMGAAAGGLVGALIDLGMEKELADSYAEAVRRGGILVAVRALGDLNERAIQVLNQFNPLNMERRVATWREQGWDGFDINAEPHEAEAAARTVEMYGKKGLGSE